jgi:uncharacterized repeat protein (TIGR03847 family)
MTDHTPVTRFVAGFIGVPGQRTFLIEIVADRDPAWFLLEKGQVAAFVAESARLLESIGFFGAGASIHLGGVAEPDEIEFRVAEIRIAYDESSGMVAVTLAPDDPDIAATLAFLTPAQLDAAVREGVEAVGAGRPMCPKCGLAMDPEGHPCPTTNGDLRHHRP